MAINNRNEKMKSLVSRYTLYRSRAPTTLLTWSKPVVNQFPRLV